MGIYARENGQGMAFPVSDEGPSEAPILSAVRLPEVTGVADAPAVLPAAPTPRPTLTRIK
jgi:stringent starvation protein B